MSEFKKWERELELLENGKSRYVWDEIEELITDRMDDGLISMEEYDTLMRRLMNIDCDL